VSCLFVGSLIVLCCTSILGQNPTENGHSYVAGPEATVGAQLVTANALRAPSKAQRALEKATAAIAHDELKEAEKQLARALELYPNYAKALTVRAALRIITGRSDAIKDLQQAIQVDPQYEAPYAILAGIYNNIEQYDDALPLVQRALQLLPVAWQVHYEMARALCGKYRSLEALREVTERRGTCRPIKRHICKASLQYTFYVALFCLFNTSWQRRDGNFKRLSTRSHEARLRHYRTPLSHD
jgi:tetratricopeptide (TPR) repeat protein